MKHERQNVAPQRRAASRADEARWSALYRKYCGLCDELAKTRERLVQQERLRSLGELASGVAHDLNNTLQAMSMRLARLERSSIVMKAQGKNLDALRRIVSDAMARMASLQQLACGSNPAPEEIVAFDLAKALRGAVELVEPRILARARLGQALIQIQVTLPDRLPRLAGTEAELRYVFVNLLLNACDAMPDGGSISIRASENDGRVAVEVADQGRGISCEDMNRIFEPFFTTKGTEGTGLGLAIASGVLKRLGGSIKVANRVEGGAIFTLDFPVAPLPGQVEQPRSSRPSTQLPKCRILLVDDDPDILESTKEVLEDLGQSVTTASTGLAALASFGAGEDFDLVLCDVGIPDMNGWSVAEQIRRISPTARIHMVTGWAQEIASDDPKRKGVAGVLPKPLEIAQIEQLLLQEQAAGPEA
jgi:signal transduction histidine kinase/CheY-like chemotaxis protein